MAVSNAGAKVNDYVKKNFPDSKADMFAVFIERCGQMTKKNGYQAMITQHAWMFLSSFEKLRTKLLAVDIVNMAHLGARAFEEIGGEVVQTTSFVIRKSHIADYKGEYCRLIEPTSQQGKEDMFLAGENRYAADQSNFSKIPGSPVAYWVSENMIKQFESNKMSDFELAHGVLTGKDELFIRFWHEVNFEYIGTHCSSVDEFNKSKLRYAPLAKGGQFRKWYGNNELVIWFDRQGQTTINSMPTHGFGGQEHYFNKGGTWTEISSGSFSIRFFNHEVFSLKAPSIFSCRHIYYLLAWMNTQIFNNIIKLLNPTISTGVGVVARAPYKIDELMYNSINEISKENVLLSKHDWDSYETSWDFKRNPLV